MNTKAVLLGAAAALALGANANAAQNGWYVGLEGGASFAEDLSGTETCPGCFSAFQLSAPTETGWAVLATVGFEWDRWRFEGEAGYRRNDIEQISFAGFPTISTNIDDLSQLTLMANVLYDISLGKRFSLSIGAGAGADRISLDWPGFNSGGGWSDDDWVFAWQGIAGLNYAMSPDCDVFVDYRYLNADGPEFHTLAVVPYSMRPDDVVTHTASLGLRYHFGQ